MEDEGAEDAAVATRYDERAEGKLWKGGGCGGTEVGGG